MAVKYKTHKWMPKAAKTPPTKNVATPPVKHLAAPPPANGNGRPENVRSRMFEEIGSSGLEAWYGFVYQAYNADLYWPGVFELYNRLRRSDPEVTITRQIFGTVASGIRIEPDLPDNPSDDDKRFQEFYAQVIGDVEGGIDRWRDTFVAYTPFMGWAWWEAVPAVRQRDWIPPDDDPWRSKYDDGLIGFRRFAFRDHSSFDSWKLDETNGRLSGMYQLDAPNPRILLPLANSVHVAFGDVENPEGLTPLEAIWRLERIKFGLEIVQGIGFEHAAGHLSVTKSEAGSLTDSDKSNIKAAARAILTAQEGNYAAWPFGFTGSVIDVPFSAAPSILAAIQHYSMLKLALYNMQWVAMSTISATGSYAALKDSTALWLMAFNQMMASGVQQLDEQIGTRLLKWNAAKFPNITRRPALKISKAEKLIDLQELGTFMSLIKDTMPLGDDDYLEFRKRTGFLPETLPTTEQSTPDAGGKNQSAGNLSSLTRAVNDARRELALARKEMKRD